MAAMNIDIDKLSYEIFSILESNFLNNSSSSSSSSSSSILSSPSKIRILSIDANSDGGLLAALSLSRLETLLRKHSGDPSARIADFFDLAAGSGSGGLLAALLFSRGPDGRSLFTADESLRFLRNRRKTKNGIFRRIFSNNDQKQYFKRIFSDLTLRDAIKPVLIPCYDLVTGSAFTFSRSDAVESDGYDFSIKDACAATCSDRAAAVEVRSADGRTRIRAMGGGVGMGNPTAAAITHVLNNKREFPLADGVEDLLVVSLGSSETTGVVDGGKLTKIVGEAAVDQVDQSVALAFGDNSTSANYVRIQTNGLTKKAAEDGDSVSAAEAVLLQRNVESIMFRGKKMSDLTNGEKIEWVSGELTKEQERRRRSSIPTVMIKPVVVAAAATPRTSSTTTATTVTVTSTATSVSSL